VVRREWGEKVKLGGLVLHDQVGRGGGKEKVLLMFARLPSEKCPYTKTDIFKTALAYSEIYPVSVHYKPVIFYNTGPGAFTKKTLYGHHYLCSIVS